MSMWPQTDVCRVISNAEVVIRMFEYTRSPLEQEIYDEYKRIRDLRPNGGSRMPTYAGRDHGDEAEDES